MDYGAFLAGKVVSDPPTGLTEIPELNAGLMPFQRDIVAWALRRGRAAIFADCGMGKTLMQLEWAHRVPGRVLILAPLAVASQTVREAAKFSIPDVAYCRDQSQVSGKITIANYEMLDHFDPSEFSGIVLDESSILKSFTGSTKRQIIESFCDTPYRLACTATPAPNDYLELGNHAEFLGVMRSNEMISRFFINDSMSAGSYRLKGHAREAFWRWIASWAVSITKPSDMGYDDSGFVLPELKTDLIVVSTDGLPAHEGFLFRDPTLSATGIHEEMRLTSERRAAAAATLVAAEPNEQWIVWCNTNYESDDICKAIPDATDIRGSMTPAEKERGLTDFVSGKTRILVTKPSVAGFGMNFQNCARVAFVGLSYSYESYYQATRRCWRFGQERDVHAYIISADSETRVLQVVKEKEAEHMKMQSEMADAVSTFHNIDERSKITSGFETATGDNWTLHLGDCVEVARSLEDCSVDLSVFSPPFSNLYIYSDSLNDMGNSASHEAFLAQYRYIADELYRVTRDGRICVIHCKDLPLYKGRDGAAGLYDLPGELLRVHMDAGFTFHSRVTIWKDPVIEMQRTKNHGLLYKQLCKDSAASRQGMADYLIVMRKWGNQDNWEAVTNGGERFHDYIGSTQSGPAAKDVGRARSEEERKRLYSIAVWQRYASPVWFDVQQTRCLNIRAAREGKDEKHICPLQLDVIERSVELWSNPGDTVFSPFAGIGSEGVVALEMGRKFIGAELKRSYWNQAKANLGRAARQESLELFAGSGDEVELEA